MSNAVQTFQNVTPDEIRRQFEASSLTKLVSDKMGINAFVEAALQLVKQPGLVACTQESVLGGLLKAAMFNFRISPELGQCWLVPRKVKVGEDENRKPIFANVAVFQIGYKGWQELSFRSGEVESFDSAVVFEKDEFDFEQGSAPFLKYKPCKTPLSRGKRTHVWASATMRSGRVAFNVADIEEIERHRRMSDTQSAWSDGERKKVLSAEPVGIWGLHYDQMAKRVPMRYLCQLQLPKSDILLSAMESDGGITNLSDGKIIEIQQKQVEETSPMELHDDYILELETANSQVKLKEIYNDRKKELAEELLGVYQSEFMKVWNKLGSNPSK